MLRVSLYFAWVRSALSVCTICETVCWCMLCKLFRSKIVSRSTESNALGVWKQTDTVTVTATTEGTFAFVACRQHGSCVRWSSCIGPWPLGNACDFQRAAWLPPFTERKSFAMFLTFSNIPTLPSEAPRDSVSTATTRDRRKAIFSKVRVNSKIRVNF